MKVLVATDAWHPQVNGVVRTYERLAQEAGPLGFEVSFIAPSQFRTVPLPTYPEIRLALATPRAIARVVERERPDFFHIATEGPLGFLMRSYCRKIACRLPAPHRSRLCARGSRSHPVRRALPQRAAGTFVATLRASLARGFDRLMLTRAASIPVIPAADGRLTTPSLSLCRRIWRKHRGVSRARSLGEKSLW
jgi:hypothetical protein